MSAPLILIELYFSIMMIGRVPSHRTEVAHFWKGCKNVMTPGVLWA